MIAEGKIRWVLEPLLVGITLTVVSVVAQNYIIYIAANVFFGMSVIAIIAFRDPPRNIGKGVVSPTDGKVVLVDSASNSVTIRTGFLNVHLVRMPLSGKVLDDEVLEPMLPGTKRKMKGLRTNIATRFGVMKILESAGSSTRGIRQYSTFYGSITKGQRIAIILPVAYVTVEIPKRFRITVTEGQKVFAGESKIAELVGLRPIQSPTTK